MFLDPVPGDQMYGDPDTPITLAVHQSKNGQYCRLVSVQWMILWWGCSCCWTVPWTVSTSSYTPSKYPVVKINIWLDDSDPGTAFCQLGFGSHLDSKFENKPLKISNLKKLYQTSKKKYSRTKCACFLKHFDANFVTNQFSDPDSGRIQSTTLWFTK